MTAKQIPLSLQSPDGSYYVTLTDGNGNLVTAGSSGLTIGTTAITGGATTQVLFNLGGVVSSDSGFTYAGSSGAVTAGGLFGTSSVGTAANPSIFVGNATTGLFSVSTTGFGISVNGANKLDYGITTAGTWTLTGGISSASNSFFGSFFLGSPTVDLGIFGGSTLDNGNTIRFTGNAGGTAFLNFPTAGAIWQFGRADAAAPVAQTFQFQNVLTGTSNIAGVNTTIKGSIGTGTGAGGQFIFQTAPAGTTGTTQNALATALTITAPAVNMQPSIVVGNQAVATNATDGFLYVATCAGTPTGTPTTFTGRVPMVFDTTNSQFWFFTGGAWKQPKTPAGAAIVTWQ